MLFSNKKFGKILSIELFVVLILIACTIVTTSGSAEEPVRSISLPPVDSFEECAQYHPVIKIYPRQCRTPDGIYFVEDASDDTLRVSMPGVGQTVHNPIHVAGEARAIFFEGEFPINLIDPDTGKILVESFASITKDCEWTAGAWCPFEAVLTLPDSVPNGTYELHFFGPSTEPEGMSELLRKLSINYRASGTATVIEDVQSIYVY